MTTTIATTKIADLEEITLTHDGKEYEVKYGIYKTYHDTINDALEDYVKAVEMATDDYR